MAYKSFSLKWWWYGQVEDLHNECAKELQVLEEKEKHKGHSWETPAEQLPYGWYSIGMESIHKKEKNKFHFLGPYNCIWESPEHVKIRSRYGGRMFQRRLSYIPKFVGVLGGLFGIIAFFMQFPWCSK